MLDYRKIYAGFGEKVGYYLDYARCLDQDRPQNMYSAQRERQIRLANLAWILMNQPADEKGCINLTLGGIVDILSKVEGLRKISTSVLQNDMHELVASTNIKFNYRSKDRKIFIKPIK